MAARNPGQAAADRGDKTETRQKPAKTELTEEELKQVSGGQDVPIVPGNTNNTTS